MNRIAILGTGDADMPDASTPLPILDAAREFRPELFTVPGAVFPDSPRARETCALAYLEAGLTAETNGYAGLYINTVGDYGLQELRKASTIPVSGAGEGAILTATGAKKRFVFVTIWPPALRFIYDAILDATASVDSCLAVHHLSDDMALNTLGQKGNFVEEMQACAVTSMKRIREACYKGLEDDGADVIILGCTCMQPVAALLEEEGIPLIEPMVSGYTHLESLLAESIKP